MVYGLAQRLWYSKQQTNINAEELLSLLRFIHANYNATDEDNCEVYFESPTKLRIFSEGVTKYYIMAIRSET